MYVSAILVLVSVYEYVWLIQYKKNKNKFSHLSEMNQYVYFVIGFNSSFNAIKPATK